MSSPAVAGLRRVGVIAALALAFPAIAAAGVQSGTVDDDVDEDIPAHLDVVKATVSHDTDAGTTVTVTLRGAPPATAPAAGPGVLGLAISARDRFDNCGDPKLVAVTPLVGDASGASAIGTAPDGAQTNVTATGAASGAVVTISVAANLGDQAGCMTVRTYDADETATDRVDLEPLAGWVRPDPPPPPPEEPPPPAPVEPPVAETYTNKVGRFGPAFRTVRKVPSLTRPGRSYIYGMCRHSVCRIDPATKRSVRVLKSAKKAQAFEDPSVSQAGSVMAFSRTLNKKRAVYRAARDGRIQRVWERGEHSPVVRADGRSITTQYTYFRQMCSVFPYHHCYAYSGPAISLRSTGEAKSKAIASDVSDVAWMRDQLVYSKDTEDGGNQDRFICAMDPEGECSRAVAKIDGRVLTAPAASPDGRYLAVVDEPSPASSELSAKYKGRILLFRPATGRLVRAVTQGKADTNPTFSPDGTQIAFNRNGNLLMVPITGGTPRLIKQKVTIATNSWGLAR